MLKSSDNQSLSVVNSSKSWKVLFLLFKLAGVILILLMEVLKDFILILLLNGYIQVLKLESLILALRASKYHLCSINKYVRRFYPYTIIENHY